MNKVLIISNIPSSYRVDFYNLLASTDKIDCNFLFIPAKDTSHKKLIWGNNNNLFYKKSIFVEGKNRINKYVLIAKQILLIKPNRIVIGGIPGYYPIIFVLKILFNIKIFCWWGGHKYSEPKNIFKRLYRKFAGISINGCFFYSEFAAEYFLKEIKNFSTDFYRIVGNNTLIADLKIYNTAPLNDRDNAAFKIISIGFQSNKNTILLLKAIRILQDRKRKMHLVVIGDGPDLIKLKQFTENYSIENVTLKGNLLPHEVYNKLVECDLLIHPSILDRWPQVINEAAVCRVPFLVSNKAGVMNAYTKKYKDIVLFNPNNENELAQKIQILMDNPLLLYELGDFAQRDAFENNGKKVFEYFLELLG